MRRREFLILAGAAGAFPLAAAAQPGKLSRIGILIVGSVNLEPMINELREGLRQLGYAEGQHVAFEQRSARGSIERLPALARDLVALKVDLIVAYQTPAVLAAKQATTDIPIVMGAVGDPVATGLVASIARPGGNVTGMSGLANEIGGKNLELLREVLPSAREVAVLANVPDPFYKPFLENMQAGAPALGIAIRPFMISSPEQLEPAFVDISRQGIPAVIVQPSLPNRRAAELALKHRLPSFAPNTEFVSAGGLGSYSPDRLALARESAAFVDKILKGRKPADLPVQLPTKFELVVNLKTANALGLTLPPTLLARADGVIE